MGHDTHHGHSKENKTIISFKNSFWLIIILVGLFVAALNFVQVESKGEEGEGHATEATHEMHGEATHEAEKAEGKVEAAAEEPKAGEAAPPAADSAAHTEQ